MKRSIAFIALFTLALTGCENSGTNANNGGDIKGVAPKGEKLVTAPTVENAGAFSYTPPAGWQMLNMPGSKYRIAMAPLRSSGVAPSINIQEETFNGTLADYAANKAAALRQGPGTPTILKDDEFQTTTGTECRRIVFETIANATKMRQWLFLFGKGNQKYLVACTAQSEGADALEPTIEAAMATARVTGE
jgi:hypothetical protein